MGDTLIFIVIFLLRAAGLIFLLRFILQACQVDFYNPISEGIVKATNPVLNPLRVVLRPYRNLDIASFLMAWLVHGAVLVIFMVEREVGLDPIVILNDSLHATISAVITVFLISIFISIAISWIAPQVSSPGTSLIRDVTEPVLSPARRVIPPIGGTLDLSPILTVLVLSVIQGPVLEGLLPYRFWQMI